MNKKGFTYIIASSILAVLVILVFLSTNQYKLQDRQEFVNTRVRAMNNFILDFNEDIHRATFISAFRTLLALEDHIAVQGTFLNNTEDSFRETFFYGTIDNISVILLNGSSLSDYITKINILAADIGIVSTINVTQIILNQSDPWSVDVYIHTTINITDTRSIASWNFDEVYLTNIPIFNLRDPIYSTFTANKLPNVIRTLNIPFLVNTSNNDTSNLIDHINDSYYIASSFAPSFIMRFQNDTTPHPFGIESIVNVQSLSDQDIEVFPDRVKVDYIYFNNLASDIVCDVQAIPTELNFSIPTNRTTLYEIDGLNYSTTC